MRFIADECAGPLLAAWLRMEGHDVLSIFEQARGISDDAVIELAVSEKRILITNDKDFGEMIFRRNIAHCGIILLRLNDERSEVKIRVMSQLLALYSGLLQDAFVVVTEDQVRFAQKR